MTLRLFYADIELVGPRVKKLIDAHLDSMFAVVDRCGIPDSFDASLSAQAPDLDRGPRTEAPDFVLRVSFEGAGEANTLSGLMWREARDRDGIVEHWVTRLCELTLRSRMKQKAARR